MLLLILIIIHEFLKSLAQQPTSPSLFYLFEWTTTCTFTNNNTSQIVNNQIRLIFIKCTCLKIFEFKISSKPSYTQSLHGHPELVKNNICTSVKQFCKMRLGSVRQPCRSEEFAQLVKNITISIKSSISNFDSRYFHFHFI